MMTMMMKRSNLLQFLIPISEEIVYKSKQEEQQVKLDVQKMDNIVSERQDRIKKFKE